jgi:hypothetical protein
MITILSILSLFGISAGIEGIEKNKIYFGVYCQNTEYGMVITHNEIYCDTILEK